MTKKEYHEKFDKVEHSMWLSDIVNLNHEYITQDCDIKLGDTVQVLGYLNPAFKVIGIHIDIPRDRILHHPHDYITLTGEVNGNREVFCMSQVTKLK